MAFETGQYRVRAVSRQASNRLGSFYSAGIDSGAGGLLLQSFLAAVAVSIGHVFVDSFVVLLHDFRVCGDQ